MKEASPSVVSSGARAAVHVGVAVALRVAPRHARVVTHAGPSQIAPDAGALRGADAVVGAGLGVPAAGSVPIALSAAISRTDAIAERGADDVASLAHQR